MPVINVVGRTVVPVLVVLAAPATVRSGNFEDGREPQGFQEPMSAASLPPIGSRVSISGLNDTDDAPCGGHLGGVSRSRPMESKSQAKLQAIEPTVNWPLTDLNKFPGKVVGVIYETGKAHAMPEFGMPAGGTACVYMMRVQPVGMTAPGLQSPAALKCSPSLRANPASV